MRASVRSSRSRRPLGRVNQRGAVLYVALIMLILLAMIGIVGMQVTGMQERMAFNYRSVNLAFQNAERRAREVECFVESEVNRTAATCGEVDINPLCDDGFDAAGWARTQSLNAPLEDRVNVRAIGECIMGNSSLSEGTRAVDEDPSPVYQVTTYATDPDSPDGAGADSAVDTIYRP